MDVKTQARNAQIVVMLDVVVFAIVDDVLSVLIDPRPDALPALPGGRFDPESDACLESGLRDRARAQHGLELGTVEQLGATASLRLPVDARGGGARRVSIAWLALARPDAPMAAGLEFRPAYRFLPWEDRRERRATTADRQLAAALQAWAGSDRRRRAEVARLFGLDGQPWIGSAAAERYALLREAGVALEPGDAPRTRSTAAAAGGELLAGAQRLSVAQGLDRLRQKLRGAPQVHPLMPAEFTLLKLQRTVEASGGLRLHKQNFRRLVENAGLVEGTGRHAGGGRGRPAELYRFAR